MKLSLVNSDYMHSLAVSIMQELLYDKAIGRIIGCTIEEQKLIRLIHRRVKKMGFVQCKTPLMAQWNKYYNKKGFVTAGELSLWACIDFSDDNLSVTFGVKRGCDKIIREESVCCGLEKETQVYIRKLY